MAETKKVVDITDRLPAKDISHLKSGGGGGTFDGMEPRIIALETSLKHVQGDVAELRSDMKTVLSRLSVIDGKLSNLPTTWQMIFAIVGPFTAIFLALVGILLKMH